MLGREGGTEVGDLEVDEPISVEPEKSFLGSKLQITCEPSVFMAEVYSVQIVLLGLRSAYELRLSILDC